MVYKIIWQQKEVVANYSIEQAQLLEIGLIEKRQDRINVANRIYESVFNQSWINQHLDSLTLTFLPKETQSSSRTPNRAGIEFQHACEGEFRISSVGEKQAQDKSQQEGFQKDKLPKLSLITEPKIQKNMFSQEVTGLQETEISFFPLPVRDPNKGKFTQKAILILGSLVLGSIFLFSFNVWTRNRETQLFDRGNQLLQQKEYDRALKTYDQLLNINSNYYQAWTNRGYALAGLEQYEQMLESCSSATDIEALAEYSWNCQGEALHYIGRYERALTAFEQAIEINFQEPIFWINKGLSLAQLQQSQASLEALNRAIELLENTQIVHGLDAVKDDLKVAYYQKGQIFFKQQQYLAALATYEQALGYGKDYLPAQWGKGIALQKLKRYEEARAEFDRILQQTNLIPQQQAITWFYLGSNLCKIGSTNAGIHALEKALQLKPNYEEAKAALTKCSAN